MHIHYKNQINQTRDRKKMPTIIRFQITNIVFETLLVDALRCHHFFPVFHLSVFFFLHFIEFGIDWKIMFEWYRSNATTNLFFVVVVFHFLFLYIFFATIKAHLLRSTYLRKKNREEKYTAFEIAHTLLLLFSCTYTIVLKVLFENKKRIPFIANQTDKR